ncbi:MAG: hypothetical protein JRF69_13790 [Deltaproteobacteria bacterium]|nr:hypothetical protein [Deltaproteobacteria bacterium]
MKIRYNPFPRVVLDGLAKLEIRIQPYYVVLEGLIDGVLHDLEVQRNEYELGFLGKEDMEVIGSIPFREISYEEILTRLKEGKMCFGAKQDGKLAAFSWCDIEEFNFKGLEFPLRKNEAYLFDAYTFDSFRGEGMAPYLRYQLYKELAKLGRHRLYSISERFNASSLKFKRKLNARVIGSGLYVDILNRWRFSSIGEKDIVRE